MTDTNKLKEELAKMGAAADGLTAAESALDKAKGAFKAEAATLQNALKPIVDGAGPATAPAAAVTPAEPSVKRGASDPLMKPFLQLFRLLQRRSPPAADAGKVSGPWYRKVNKANFASSVLLATILIPSALFLWSSSKKPSKDTEDVNRNTSLIAEHEMDFPDIGKRMARCSSARLLMEKKISMQCRKI